MSENVLCKALYSGEKKRGLERLLDDLGFIPNLNHYCKKLALFMFLKPLLCTQDYAYVHMLWPVYAGCYPCTWVEGHFGHLFPKINFYSFKMLYFPF